MYFEQRKFSRVPCRATVKVYNDTSCWKTELVDISKAGLQIKKPAGWLMGDAVNSCTVIVGNKLKLELNTKVAYCNTQSMGLVGSNENLKTLYNVIHLMAIKSAREKVETKTERG